MEYQTQNRYAKIPTNEGDPDIWDDHEVICTESDEESK